MRNKKYRKKISIGYNGQPDFFEKIILPFEYYISSVYAAPPAAFGVASSRAVLGDPAEMLRFRKKLKAKKIEFNLVFNFDGIDSPDIIKKLFAAAHYFKPDLITLNGTFILDSFLKFTKYKLNISIINDINTINQLDQLMERDPGGKRIVSYNIGRRKTFDPAYIEAVRKRYPKLRLKLMVNEGCIFECPDQNFHSCSMTIRNMVGKGAPTANKIFYCHKLKPDQHWRFLSGQYIPPKFLHHWCDLVDEMKIASRGSLTSSMDMDSIVEMLREYVEEKDITIKRAMLASYAGSGFAKSYFNSDNQKGNGNNYVKKYPADFFEVRSKCNHECYKCGYCRNILKKGAQ